MIPYNAIKCYLIAYYAIVGVGCSLLLWAHLTRWQNAHLPAPLVVSAVTGIAASIVGAISLWIYDRRGAKEEQES